MPARLRANLSYANVMSTIAVFIVLGGGAYAATKLPKNSVGTKQIRNGAVTKAKLAKGLASAGPKGDAGAQGAKGDKGDQGLPGANGTNGSDGSPDTAAQVLGKLTQVDGSGSALDADTLDGVNVDQVRSDMAYVSNASCDPSSATFILCDSTVTVQVPSGTGSVLLIATGSYHGIAATAAGTCRAGVGGTAGLGLTPSAGLGATATSEEHAFAFQVLVSVAPGDQTYHIECNEGGAGLVIDKSQLTALVVPG